jgi:hypothetical protein
MPDRDRSPYSAVARGGLIAAAILCLGASNGDGQHSSRHGRAQAEQANTQITNAALAGAPDQNGARGPADPGPKSESPKDWFGLTPEALSARSTFVLTVATVLLFIATGVLAGFTWGLFGDGKRSLMHARASAKIAHRALDHARQAAQSARDSEERLERAYAYLGLAEDGFMVCPYGFRLKISIQNFGKTPAFVKQIVASAIMKIPSIPGQYIQISKWTYDIDLVWGAGQQNIGCVPDFGIPGGYIGIELTYDDIFAKRHFSRSLYLVNASKLTLEDGAVKADFADVYWNAWD